MNQRREANGRNSKNGRSYRKVDGNRGNILPNIHRHNNSNQWMGTNWVFRGGYCITMKRMRKGRDICLSSVHSFFFFSLLSCAPQNHCAPSWSSWKLNSARAHAHFLCDILKPLIKITIEYYHWIWWLRCSCWTTILTCVTIKYTKRCRTNT